MGIFGHPLATQEDVEEAISKVSDLEETEFAAESRDAKTFVEKAIDAVHDLEETDFAAEPRDAEVTPSDKFSLIINIFQGIHQQTNRDCQRFGTHRLLKNI